MAGFRQAMGQGVNIRSNASCTFRRILATHEADTHGYDTVAMMVDILLVSLSGTSLANINTELLSTTIRHKRILVVREKETANCKHSKMCYWQPWTEHSPGCLLELLVTGKSRLNHPLRGEFCDGAFIAAPAHISAQIPILG